jgi:hypothetical protein
MSLRRWFLGLLALSSVSAFVHAAVAPVALKVDVLSFSAYPSMQPVTAVRVHLSGTQESQDLVQTALKGGWDCSKISSYKVSIQGTSGEVAIANLRLEPDPQCTVGVMEPNAILVIKDHNLSSDAKLVVALANLPAGLAAQSVATSFPKPTSAFGLTITPQAAPGEALTTGIKRDVGQLSIALTAPEVFPSLRQATIFINSTDLFSTDATDSKSAFSGILGVKRGLSGRWYTPLSIQENMQGNQNATSMSSVSSLSFGTIAPWAWNKHVLYNDYFQAPSPPELTVNAGYTHRFAQNVTKATPLLAVDDFSLNPYATFTPIYFLSGWCSQLQKKLNVAAPSKSKQYCLGLQTDLGMWYLPLDKTKAGSQRAEGYGDVTVLIPLSDIPFKFLNYLASGSSANSQLLVKYSDDVNASNNYARTKQWTYGFQLIK